MTAKTIKDAVDKIAAMNYTGDIKAIFCVIIDKDGDIQQETCFPADYNLSIIAAVEMIKVDIINHILATSKHQKPRDL